MPDEMKITILPDGTVKIETDAISGANHMTAERALQWIAAELGGATTRTKRAHGHTHDEAHDHEHH